MGMSDCPRCWDTPCSCGYMYWFLDLARLEEVVRVATKALGDRRGNRKPPGAVQEELERRAAASATRMTAADFARRVDIPTRLVDLEEARAQGAALRVAASTYVDEAMTQLLAAAHDLPLLKRCGDKDGDLCHSCGERRSWDGCGTLL